MSHGHDDGHGAAADAVSHGPAEFPAVPDPRMITPAREDYLQPFSGRGLLWPFLWLAIAFAFHAAALRWHGEVEQAGEATPDASSEGVSE